jgi:hypothetical protein
MPKQSNVTKDSAGLLLYSIYYPLKRGEKISLTKIIEGLGMSPSVVSKVLKSCGILSNPRGGAGAGVEWKWMPPSAPDDPLIARFLKAYETAINSYLSNRNEARKKKSDDSAMEKKLTPLAKPSPGGPSNIYLQERIEILTDKMDYLLDMHVTLLKQFGITETVGGRKL